MSSEKKINSNDIVDVEIEVNEIFEKINSADITEKIDYEGTFDNPESRVWINVGDELF